MQETKPLLLGAASIIGIMLIGFFGEMLEPEFTHLRDIDSNMRNEVVHVRGIVRELKPFSAGIRLLLEQDGFMLQVVYFGEASGKKGMCADVIGEVKTRNGAIEVSASRVRLFVC